MKYRLLILIIAYILCNTSLVFSKIYSYYIDSHGQHHRLCQRLSINLSDPNAKNGFTLYQYMLILRHSTVCKGSSGLSLLSLAWSRSPGYNSSSSNSSNSTRGKTECFPVALSVFDPEGPLASINSIDFLPSTAMIDTDCLDNLFPQISHNNIYQCLEYAIRVIGYFIFCLLLLLFAYMIFWRG